MSAPVAIVGAGLSGGLLAYRLRERRPDVAILLVEEGAVGGNHTWSFHEHDLDSWEHSWIDPFVEHRWPGYEVRFPTRRRRVATGYRSISSDRFREVVEDRLGSRIRFGSAEIAGPAELKVDDASIEVRAVIDARGPRAMPALDLGFQKFVGCEFEFASPHGLREPVVMDATVAQNDGYRFVYSLPLTPTRMLVEDTYYADGDDLAPADLERRAADYALEAGWGEGRLVRREEGVLPIALGGDIERHLHALAGVPTIGLGAALFHPTTGYSLPDAVRTADFVAALPDLDARTLSQALSDRSRRLWRDRRFFHLLNRMLFRAGDPAARRDILAHFYRLPDPLVARFYAAKLGPVDKARILIGKPPVPVRGAVRALIKAPS